MWTVNSLTCEIDGKRLLEDVSFTVPRGEFVSIIGPNGAGKTTLLRHLNRVLPAGAAVRLSGRPLRSWPIRDLAKTVSWVPQMKEQAPPFDVSFFLLMSRHPHLSLWHGPSRQDRDLVEDVMDRAGLRELASHSLQTLSGGERQRVYIAAAMAQETPAILLDEPTAFLDPWHDAHVGSLLEDLNRRDGKTIVMVTHDINAARRLSHRIVGLRKGRVAFDLPAAEVGAEALESLFGVPFVQYSVSSAHTSGDVFLPLRENPRAVAWATTPEHPGGHS